MPLSELLNSPLFVGGGLAFLATVSLLAEVLLQDRNRVNKRIQEESQRHQRERVSQSRLFKDWKSSDKSQFDEQKRQLWQQLELFVEQSGTHLTIQRICRLCLWTAGILAATGLLLTFNPGWAACAAVFGLALPLIYLARKRHRRIRELREQLPEAFDLMSRAVQSGQTMVSAFQLVARQAGPPVAEEFSYCCEQQNLGLPYETTLRDLARRTGVMELQMFSVAMILQRQAGGNPIELLNNLSELVRQRTKLALKVKAITGEGRMQAWVLSALPCLSLAGIYVLDPGYAAVLLEQPKLLIGLGISILCGILWIRRIVYFEY